VAAAARYSLGGATIATMRRFLLLLTLAIGCGDDDPRATSGAGGAGTTGGTSTTTATVTSSMASSTSSTSSSSSASSASSGGGGSDGGGGEGGGTLPGCTLEPELDNRGAVAALSSTALTQSFANASFIPGTGTCSTQLCGGCRVRTCLQQLSPPPASADAGTITITGGDRDVQLVLIPGGSYDSAATYSTTETLFGGGELIAFESTGGDVPAFTQVLEAPSELLVSAPSFDDLVVPLNNDFEVTWSGDSVGIVEVGLLGQNLPPPSPDVVSFTTVTCEFSVAAGSGVVPAVALQGLMPTDEGVVSVRATSSTELTLGIWSVRVGLAGLAAATNSSSGSADAGGVVFQ
jgi:hypothetical protein